MTDSAPDRLDFFISYTHTDDAWAQWAGWVLEEAGYKVKLMAWDFGPGSNFAHEMHKATQHAERTLMLLSPAYLESAFSETEWLAAFVQDPHGDKRKLLPVRIAPCAPEGLLRGIVHTDLVGLDEAAARDRLLAAAKNQRAKPAGKPGFPGGGARAAADARPAPAFPGGVPAFPGGVPAAIHNLPFLPLGELFKGRDAFVDLLHAPLTQANGRPQVLHGLGGVGKTRLALEYAWRYRRDYAALLWVAADTAEELRRNVAALCRAELLNLSESEIQDETRQYAAVCRHLRVTPGWLLIVDNADSVSAAAAVEQLALDLAGGSLLVTSRIANWGGGVDLHAVDLLAADAAAAFLIERTRGRRRVQATDVADAHALAEQELQCLPLALEQAGAFIAKMGISIAGYRARWQKGEAKLRQFHDARLMHYPASVAATWLTSMDAAGAPARAVLYVL
ncbi:MAG: toll/interleukin-1 receptor domain-containing protein, partial [Rhodocyclaceae bacterium]|nr:toll/interleukin-1 receptor domain-containing protein [Rhodocyclaceae bacterium]